ncbi:major Facilitator Superfamily protein [Paecilomyces variotii No. 5]|uniref:Major Facilitator Superfamily protein n=1 Tax=Byssochlamys spectabilis (strain No. 5 / NBRC 109023) TaxID=1356009 RepID=V5FD88_BYSSN|nr:major Facilitator Superfamily protein [Paecilomyces variotii No. 5]
MSQEDSEKGHVDLEVDQAQAQREVDLDRLGEKEGYVLDATTFRTEHGGPEAPLKLAPDGKTVLIPQPSDDPNDTLNWSRARKHLVLFIISAVAFLPDYGSATGAVTLIPQAEIWHMSQDTVNHSQVGNVFMLGAGGLLVTILSAYFGRLPVLFWFLVFAVWTAAWCAGAHGFSDFMAARILNGFFSTVAQGGGLMFIKDMFFFHEQARKINIWASFIVLSPYFGPLFAAFIISTQSWRIPFVVYTLETFLCLALVVLFVDETYYNRSIPQSAQPPRKSRFMRLIGLEQWKSRSQRSSLKEAIMRPVKVVLKPTVAISVFYYLCTFAWVVGINTTLAMFVTPLYNFGPLQIGYFYFTPIIAAILGEIAGHWLHDWLANMYARRHHGHVDPEARLLAIWISTPFVVAGLIFLGFCLERGYHFMLTALAWGLYVFGIMITTVAVSAYNLDAYPEGSGEVAAWVNFGRTTGGFIVSYFQVTWAQKLGTERSFGTQAGICFGVFILCILPLQMFGKKLRRWSGDLDFKTN